MSEASDTALVDRCIVAAAEAWRDDGEVLATGIGLIPRLAAGLAFRTLNPDLMMTDGEAYLVAEPVPVGPRGDYVPKFEGWMPYSKVFENLWGGKRHAMLGPTQIDRFGQANISVIGDYAKPKAALLGVRGFPGNTINHANSFFVPNHGTRVFVPKVDMASSVGNDPSTWPAGTKRDFVDLRIVVTNLAVLDFQGPGGTLRLTHTHPGVSVSDVQENTGFELALADTVAETAAPTDEQLEVIHSLDPHNQRAGAVKG